MSIRAAYRAGQQSGHGQDKEADDSAGKGTPMQDEAAKQLRQEGLLPDVYLQVNATNRCC